MSSIKKAALALVNLRRSDQLWILNNLQPMERTAIQAEIKRLRQRKGIQSLSFNEILQLSKDDETEKAAPPSDSMLAAWQALAPDTFKTVFETASDFTVWLIFKWDRLPDRTLLAKYLNSDQSRRVQQLERQGNIPATWLVDLAIQWVLTEFAGWKPPR